MMAHICRKRRLYCRSLPMKIVSTASSCCRDATCAGTLEQREGALVGIEHHLLCLARIGAKRLMRL